MSIFEKNYFFTLENAKTQTNKNFELDVDQMILVIFCMVDTVGGVADMMHGKTARWYSNKLSLSVNYVHIY